MPGNCPASELILGPLLTNAADVQWFTQQLSAVRAIVQQLRDLG